MSQKPAASPFSAKSDPRSDSAGPRRRRSQLPLARVMLILTVATAALAPLAYLARGLRGSRESLFVFILFSVAAPSLLLICAAAIHFLLGWLNRIKHS